MEFETEKYYKHTKREIFIKVLGRDYRNYINIRYANGKTGQLIPDAPGWEEISKKEWDKVKVVPKTEE